MTTDPAGSAPAQRARPGTALYVHLPFCAAKCPYCDFFSVAVDGHDVDRLIDAVVREATERAPLRPRTVFFGGGTPSLLTCAQLEKLLGALDRITGFRGAAEEVTVECNPESLDRDKARALLGLGATRLSIGFQSLNDERLRSLGRVHDSRACFEAFEAARAAGAQRVNVDLMYGVPGQGVDEWGNELGLVIALKPEHVSAYNLTFEPGTPFSRWRDEGRLRGHSEDVELAFFERTRQQLASSGYEAYEVSNYSVIGGECLHNVGYWHNSDYAGIGPSAVSKAWGSRFGNVRSVGEYVQRIASGSPTHVWSESLPPIGRLGETWWLGLRLRRGLAPAEALQRAECDLDRLGWPSDPALPVIESLVELGLLERDGERVRLSPRGEPLADAVAREFLDLEAPNAPPRMSAPCPA